MASGMPVTLRVFDLTHLPTSFSTMGCLNRSAKRTAIAGSIFHAVRMSCLQDAWFHVFKNVSQKIVNMVCSHQKDLFL